MKARVTDTWMQEEYYGFMEATPYRERFKRQDFREQMESQPEIVMRSAMIATIRPILYRNLDKMRRASREEAIVEPLFLPALPGTGMSSREPTPLPPTQIPYAIAAPTEEEQRRREQHRRGSKTASPSAVEEKEEEDKIDEVVLVLDDVSSPESVKTTIAY